MEIDKIKIHPIEMCSEMACCIAYCIGATSDNVEEIANKIPEDMVWEYGEEKKVVLTQGSQIGIVEYSE